VVTNLQVCLAVALQRSFPISPPHQFWIFMEFTTSQKINGAFEKSKAPLLQNILDIQIDVHLLERFLCTPLILYYIRDVKIIQ